MRRTHGHLGARPIALPLADVAQYVEQTLTPRVHEAIERLARRGGDEPIGERLQVSGGRLDIPSVRGGAVPVDAYVQSAPSNSKVSMTTGGGYSPESRIVVVWFNGALTPNELLGQKRRFQSLRDCSHGGCVSFALYDTLIHELTHVADVLPRLKHDPDRVAAEDETVFAVYYNDPSEVRAYMRQVVEESARNAGLLRDYAKGRQDTVAKALKMSETWKQIDPYLTPANRQKILLAVYDRMSRDGLL